MSPLLDLFGWLTASLILQLLYFTLRHPRNIIPNVSSHNVRDKRPPKMF